MSERALTAKGNRAPRYSLNDVSGAGRDLIVLTGGGAPPVRPVASTHRYGVGSSRVARRRGSTPWAAYIARGRSARVRPAVCRRYRGCFPGGVARR